MVQKKRKRRKRKVSQTLMMMRLCAYACRGGMVMVAMMTSHTWTPSTMMMLIHSLDVPWLLYSSTNYNNAVTTIKSAGVVMTALACMYRSGRGSNMGRQHRSVLAVLLETGGVRWPGCLEYDCQTT